jgi:hypothetical protein
MGDDTRYHHIAVVLLRRFRAQLAPSAMSAYLSAFGAPQAQPPDNFRAMVLLRVGD